MLYPVLQDPLHPIVSSLFDRPRGASIGQMLFGAGEQGGWYDVSDMSTLFQDSAGATPVTAVEQPVGRILDKSGRGNHATQATTTKRPVLSRRYNLLNTSSASAFVNYDVNVTLGAAQGPDGSMSAALVSPIASSLAQFSTLTTSGAPDFTSFVIVKKRDYRYVKFLMVSGMAVFDLDTGAFVTNPGNYFSRAFGDGWYLVGARRVISGGWTIGYQFSSTTETSTYFDYPDRNRQIVPDADGVKGNYFAGASITHTTDAHLPYQWVNTATDYDADPAKFPAYLRFDGVDDALQTGDIDFTGTDKMTVWAGITKLSDAGSGQIVHCGVHNSQPGFILSGPSSSPNPNFLSRSRGSIASAGAYTPPIYPAPISASLTVQCSVPDKVNTLRVNGASYFDGTDQGSGKYANATVYIGAAFGTSTFFNGRLYSLIVRGAQTPLSQIEATELYIKQKMRLP